MKSWFGEYPCFVYRRLQIQLNVDILSYLFINKIVNNIFNHYALFLEVIQRNLFKHRLFLI